MDERYVDLEVDASSGSSPTVEIFSAGGLEDLEMNLRDMLGSVFPKQPKRRKVKVPEALQILANAEASKLIDMDKVVEEGPEKGGAGRYRLFGRNRQDRHPGAERPGAGRQPRGRAARPPAFGGRAPR